MRPNEHSASALHPSARRTPDHFVARPPSDEVACIIDGVLYHDALDIASRHTDGGGTSGYKLRTGISARLLFRSAHFGPRRAAPEVGRCLTCSSPGRSSESWSRPTEKMPCASRRQSAQERPVPGFSRSASALIRVTMAWRLLCRKPHQVKLFMLDWLYLPELRGQATVEFNKGEAQCSRPRCLLPPFWPVTRSPRRGTAISIGWACLVTAAIALPNIVSAGRSKTCALEARPSRMRCCPPRPCGLAAHPPDRR